MTAIGDRPVSRWGASSLTPRQACCLRLACDAVPDVYASPEGRYAPDDAWPLSELPDWVLFMVNLRWRQRFLMLFGDIGARVARGVTPHPRCFAECVVLWIALSRARWIADDVADDDEGWDQLRDLMFGDDLDFRLIWHQNATNKILPCIAGHPIPPDDPASRWHPYRWWDVGAADLPPAA